MHLDWNLLKIFIINSNTELGRSCIIDHRDSVIWAQPIMTSRLKSRQDGLYEVRIKILILTPRDMCKNIPHSRTNEMTQHVYVAFERFSSYGKCRLRMENIYFMGKNFEGWFLRKLRATVWCDCGSLIFLYKFKDQSTIDMIQRMKGNKLYSRYLLIFLQFEQIKRFNNI